ncbi:MAG: polysaccharide biosynthesis tyrosine autokinase, partial [Anaerolineae bacterium]|nr:polysaccharide biosynthesis tyrosine autokinase [Anaerolineae bacterium]
MELRTYLAILWRQKWVIVISTIVTALVTALGVFMMAPTYEASTTLRVSVAGGASASYTEQMYATQLKNTFLRIATSDRVLEELAQRLGLDEHPKVGLELLGNSELMRLTVVHQDPQLAQEAANIMAGILIDLNRELYVEVEAATQEILLQQLAEAEDEVGQAWDDYQETLAELPDDSAAILAAGSAWESKQQTYDDLLAQYEQSQVREVLKARALSVYDPADLPDTPAGLPKVVYVALGATVGAIVGVGAAFLREQMEDTIKTPHEVRQSLGLNTLSTISRMSRAERGSIVTAQPRSPHAEAFRILCSNAGLYGEYILPKTILVTSPSGNEGKSLISANLAMTLAQARLRVVAVDADLRRPKLSQFFDLDPRSEGLSRALLTGSIDGLLRPTQVSQLAILPSGGLPADPAELLSSPRTQDVLDQLAQRADVILVDGPPILAVADTALIARRVDGVLLVVRAGRTRREVAQSAVENLHQTGARVVGVVLNDVDPRRSIYHRTYHQYMSTARVEQQLQAEQADGDAPDGTGLGPSAGGELDAQVQEAPARPQPMAGILPGVPSMPDAQDAAPWAGDTADRLPSGVATSTAEEVGEAEYEPFVHRELSEVQVEYLFLDALRKPLPSRQGEEEGVACAWAFTADGGNVLLHVASCRIESYEMWLDFLQDMVKRGLSVPVLAIAPGTSGALRAIGEVFPHSLQQSCLSHRIRTVSKL